MKKIVLVLCVLVIVSMSMSIYAVVSKDNCNSDLTTIPGYGGTVVIKHTPQPNEPGYGGTVVNK